MSQYPTAEALQAHEAEMQAMRERQGADRRAAIEKHDAAVRAIKLAEQKAKSAAEDLMGMTERDEEEISAAMQAFEIKVAARRLYHEAPNDVFELSFPPLSDVDEHGWGKGGLNVMRLVNKRCMQVVESVATRLTGDAAVDLLPLSALKRCSRIEHVSCYRLRSLEGCPDGLKSLFIKNGHLLQSLEPLSACKGLETLEIRTAHLIFDLSPLSSCTRLKKLTLRQSKVTDLTPLSSMLLLEELDLHGGSVKDISVLSQCYKLKILMIGCNNGIEDLSPLCQCPDLDELITYYLPLIKDLSFLEKGFSKLRVLNISSLQVGDFSPLTTLQSLEKLDCEGIPPTTSLLPLARCYKLKKVINSRIMDVQNPNAPKGALGSHMLFSADMRPSVKKDFPDLKITEVAKKMGEMWKAIDKKTKKKYEDLAAKDKERYQKELAKSWAKYKEKYYF